MVNVYMSSAEAEARSPYLNNPTTAGYGGGNYAHTGTTLQRSSNNDQYSNQRTVRVEQWNNATRQWESVNPNQPEAAQKPADPSGGAMWTRQYADPVAAYRGAQAGQAGASQGKNYFDRADIYAVEDKAQQNLMNQGYTQGQAAEMLRFDAQQRHDYKNERKYETLVTQAWTTATGESGAYHYAAKESGLPQAANPYEYGADLFTYAMKGYPQKKSERFSPVDYGILNLPEGKGQQAYTWEKDADRQYDLRPAMDKVAYAQRTGQMGVYGNVESVSSTYGKLSVGEQQAVGRYVNENPIHQAMGFRTNDAAMLQFTPEVMAKNQGAFVSSVSPTIATTPPPVYTERKSAVSDQLNKDWNPMVVSAAPISGNISQQAEPSAYRKEAAPNFALDVGGAIKRPFLSTSMTDRVEVTKEKQSGALPYIGVIPGLSPFIANFMPQKVTEKTIGKEKDYVISGYDQPGSDLKNPEGGYGAYQTRTFITNKGKSDTWTYPVGEPILSAPTPKGNPILTRTYDPKTGETTIYSEQVMEQNAMQNYETVTLPKTMRGQEITTTVTEGKTPFTESVQRYMPELKEQKTTLASTIGVEKKPVNPSPLFGAWDTGNGKPTYILSPLIGQERATKLDESTIGVVGFIQKQVPGTPVWAQTSYKNIREDPLFAAPIVAMSVALPAAGGAIKYVSPTGAASIFAAPAYKGASQIATVGLSVLFADYASKQVTGTSITEVLGNERNRQLAAGGFKTDKPVQSSSELIQKQWIGWEKSGDRANQLGLEMAAGYGAYTATDWAVTRTTQFRDIKVDARTQPTAARRMTEAEARQISQESNEGFTTLNSIEQKDLRQSYIEGRMATSNPGKITEAKYSITGRKLGSNDFPTNPQVNAAPGTTDIYSGQPSRRLDRGYVSAGMSEIQGMSYSPSGITYFAKVGDTGAGLGISDDILGLGKRPTMYASATNQRYQEVPKHIRELPTLGLSANDPGNPRNLAITDWINRYAEPGVPVLVQHGKSEFEFHIKAGSEVAPKQHLGYYMDSGIPIPVIRQDFTGRMSPTYVQKPLQPKEYKFYSGLAIGETGSAVGSSTGGGRERVIPYGVSSLFKSTGKSTVERSNEMTASRPRSETLALSKSISSLSRTRSISSVKSSISPSRTSSVSESRSRSPSRTPSLFSSKTPSKTTTTPKYESTMGRSKTPSISTSLSRSTTSMKESSWSRSRSTSQTPSRSITTSITPSRTRTTIPVEPPFMGGLVGGLGVGGSGHRGGRRSTQIFTPNFGQVTASLFGGTEGRAAPIRAGTKKKKKR